MVFSAEGRAHVLEEAAFNLLFVADAPELIQPAPRKFRFKEKAARKQAAKPKAAAPAAAAESTGLSPSREALFSEIRKTPITSAEGKDVLRRAGLSEASAYTVLGKMRDEGLIEKRECPQTHLEKWFPVRIFGCEKH